MAQQVGIDAFRDAGVARDLAHHLTDSLTGVFALQDGIVGEARIVERVFGLGPCALTEVMALLQDRLANAEA